MQYFANGVANPVINQKIFETWLDTEVTLLYAYVVIRATNLLRMVFLEF
jgi:hypothetical protein